ncbi:hypothetical protein I7I48_01936 [Histoplasma ohiense]|nr:hypothetical protein I7I48_01936 [Histoplasma ohiense (nom. inval.)]
MSLMADQASTTARAQRKKEKRRMKEMKRRIRRIAWEGRKMQTATMSTCCWYVIQVKAVAVGREQRSHGCLSCHHHRDAIEKPLSTAGWSDTREHLLVSHVKLELVKKEEGVDDEGKNVSLTVIYSTPSQIFKTST